MTSKLLEENGTKWSSIYVASLIAFMGSVQMSIFFNSLWPFLKILDPSATETFFGYVVSSYSIGQIIAFPLFGYWSNKINQVKKPLWIVIFLLLISQILYVFLEVIPFHRKYFMLLSRFLLGLDSALLRTFVSNESQPSERAKVMAILTCGTAIGNSVGPAIQIIFVPLDYPGIRLFPNFSLNIYTAPAFMSILMNIFTLFLLHFCFKETHKNDVNHSEKHSFDDGSEKSMSFGVFSYDIIAVLVCYIVKFTQMFVNTNIETLGSPFAMMMFGWTNADTVLYTSIAHAFLGGMNFLVYMLYIFFKFEKKVNNRVSSLLSLFLFLLFYVLTFSWPFLPGKMPNLKISAPTNSSEPLGCNPEEFSWCFNLNPVNPWIFYISYIVLVGSAFPILNITLPTILSIILDSRNQGTQQGILQMSGSVARMLGPILLSTIYTGYGPRLIWIIEAVVILMTIGLWTGSYRRIPKTKY